MLTKKIYNRILSQQNIPQSLCQKQAKIHNQRAANGFGAIVTQLIENFIPVFFQNSTIVAKGLLFDYLKQSNLTWDHYILPLSETCQPNAGRTLTKQNTDSPNKGK